jgi:hypothetical protein
VYKVWCGVDPKLILHRLHSEEYFDLKEDLIVKLTGEIKSDETFVEIF